MHLSINKYKLYLYVLFFIFLSSIFNLKFLEFYQNKFNLKNINITGLSMTEKKIVENELENLKNINIFKISRDKVFERLNKFNFLENISVDKVIPSSLDIHVSLTSIIGKSLRNGEIYYIGKNGKFINPNQLFIDNEIPTVFGDFEIDEFLNLQKILNKNKIEISKIKQYYYFKNKRWDLLFTNGIILMLPSKKIKNSINIYKKILKSENITNIKIIDLRVPNQIILTTNNE